MYIDILKQIINNYERFKEIAVNLECVVVNSVHLDWYKKYPVGITVDIINFPEGYVKNNFEKAYVQAVMSYIAWAEEWKQNFWNLTAEKRLFCLTKGRLEDYISYKEVRMKSVTEEYLIKEIKWHAEENSIPESEVSSVIPYLTGAENIEIGGCYYRDHTFISVKDNSIMLLDCGIWD